MCPQSNMNGIPIKSRHLDTDSRTGKAPCGDEGQDQDNAAEAKEAKAPRKPPEAGGEACDRLSCLALRRTQPTVTLISDFQCSGCETGNCYCSKAPGSPGKLLPATKV